MHDPASRHAGLMAKALAHVEVGQHQHFACDLETPVPEVQLETVLAAAGTMQQPCRFKGFGPRLIELGQVIGAHVRRSVDVVDRGPVACGQDRPGDHEAQLGVEPVRHGHATDQLLHVAARQVFEVDPIGGIVEQDFSSRSHPIATVIVLSLQVDGVEFDPGFSDLAGGVGQQDRQPRQAVAIAIRIRARCLVACSKGERQPQQQCRGREMGSYSKEPHRNLLTPNPLSFDYA